VALAYDDHFYGPVHVCGDAPLSLAADEQHYRAVGFLRQPVRQVDDERLTAANRFGVQGRGDKQNLH
jgi:hypothetical protein